MIFLPVFQHPLLCFSQNKRINHINTSRDWFYIGINVGISTVDYVEKGSINMRRKEKWIRFCVGGSTTWKVAEDAVGTPTV